MASLTIDDEIYGAYAEEAKRLNKSPEEFIEDALRDWLTEFQDDVQAANEGIAEYERTGKGTDIEHVLRERGIEYQS